MAKAKIQRGSGFRGAVEYDLGASKGASIVGGNMVGTTPKELAAEFGLSRAMRSEVDRPVLHMSISCPPGERLSDEEWRAVSDRFMELMGLAGHQFVGVRHTDRPHDHIHITASRIKLDGSLWHGKWEAFRAIEACQRIEREFGLTLTPGLDDRADAAPEQAPVNRDRKNVTQNEIEQADRTGDAPVRLRLQEILDDVLDGPQTALALMDRLAAAGVSARPNIASTGRLNGFSFELDGIAFKASQLGKSYAWKKMQERGVEYEPERDAEAVRDRANRLTETSSKVTGRELEGVSPEARSIGDGREPDHSSIQRELGSDGGDLPGSDAAVGETDQIGVEADPGRDAEAFQGTSERSEGNSGSDQNNATASENAVISAKKPEPPVLFDDLDPVDVGAAWNDAIERIADLASPEPEFGDQHLSESPRPITKSQKVKLDAWERQHSAIGAPLYRVTLMRATDAGKVGRNLGKGRGPEGSEKFYSAPEIAGLIPFLSGENLRGWNIYITPIDPNMHFIIVDDVTHANLDRLDKEGFTPALVMETSSNSHQALLKTPREKGDQKAANMVVVGLNKDFGDPKFTGAIHPMRLAGFSNKKPGKGSPFTKILRATGELCERTGAFLSKAKRSFLDKVSRRKPDQERTVTALPEPRPIPHLPPPTNAIAKRHDHLRAREVGLAESKGWKIDQSSVDYRVAKQLLIDGYASEDVASALLQRSPDIETRHPKPWKYVSRTVENANSKIEQAKRSSPGEDNPSYGDDGPGF